MTLINLIGWVLKSSHENTTDLRILLLNVPGDIIKIQANRIAWDVNLTEGGIFYVGRQSGPFEHSCDLTYYAYGSVVVAPIDITRNILKEKK